MRIPSSAITKRATNFTTGNRSDAITVATWVSLVVLVVFFLSREVIKFTVVRKFAIDDLFILAATIFAAGLTVTALRLASDGLGVDSGSLTVRRAYVLMKAYYASNFLYIASLGFAKLSLVVFFYKIHQVQRTQRRVVLGFGIFILAWTVASLVAIAFQCGLPQPWEMFSLHCYDLGSFWVVFCIIDMTTDVSLVMLSVNLVYYLKVKSSRKVAVVACFAPRILVIGASLTRLVYLYPITPHTNPSFNLWLPVICTQVQVSLSIVTACIPYMRPFFYSSDAQVPGDVGSRRHMMAADASYTHFSSNDYARGHKRGQGLSHDSTPNSWECGRTPDVSPRIPSPAPLSPLLPPRVTTPASTVASNSRSPSERGLRLQIPTTNNATLHRTTFISPQTASSHALSPDCMSPVQPFLPNTTHFTSIPLTPRTPTPPLPCHTPPNGAAFSGDESNPEPPVRNSLKRFSLFPPHQAQRYSLVPQSQAQPPTSAPNDVSQNPRSNSRSPAGATSMSRITPHVGASETHTTSPATPAPHTNPLVPAPILIPTTMRKSPPRANNPTVSFATIVHEDPLRSKFPPATALTTSAPVPAPIITAPLAPVLESPPRTSHQALSTPPRPMSSAQRRRMRSDSSPTVHTPPPSRPPTGPLPQPPTSSPSRPRARSSPYRYPSTQPSPPVVSPTSPTRQRNRRILTPGNSMRDFNMSPISPVSPPTPMQFWREDAFGNGAGRTTVPSVLWEEQDLQTRENPRMMVSPMKSPRIVLQRFER
ncbi:unnamed protein product [Periconia digitata]|uniref:Rhodopsin domain-containing protein n=1 Tax=Periconia digitata TaxID=1303443 RepID=A0A9W4U914_9PLEO|nr:unnamed protein product [Periconia digitata]